MKKTIALLILLAACLGAGPQSHRLDSLLTKIEQTEDINGHYVIVNDISGIPGGDSALLKRGKNLLAKADENTRKKEHALLLICYAYRELHDSPTLLEVALQAIRYSRDANDKVYLSLFLQSAAQAYRFSGDIHKSATYSLLALSASMEMRDTTQAVVDFSNLESDYAMLKMPDSALNYARREFHLVVSQKITDKIVAYGIACSDLGEAFTAANLTDSALVYYRRSYNLTKTINFLPGTLPYMLNNMAETFLKLNQTDSALKYATKAYDQASITRMWDYTYHASALLAKIYEGKDEKKALFYLKAATAAKDSIDIAGASRQFQLINDKEQQRLRDLEDQREKFSALIRFYAVIAAAVLLLAVGVILWRNNRKQKRTNHLLSEQKEEISSQRDELEHTIEQLKATQTQLIQSEKMASLGELTAGIAHEIQNPLNFVNNFSEVSAELLDEMDEELEKGDTEEARAIGADLKQNLEKIKHHGKRADFIVKGMLEHSRANTGEKQPTDINVLCDEFLKLSYHGLRAKDKSFNAEMITHFDPKLPKVRVSQQDMGRVMLNLFNNAFYAVNQKQKKAGADYKPEVSVSTSTENGLVAIKVKDNGIGIPDSIKDKIMQPFFTNKPTGEGTGLGLSLTYEMVVKGHGGNIQVNSVESEGSEFIITLQLS